MLLRKYQQDCVNAIWRHVRASNSPCVAVIPTGGGKSPIAAQIAKDTVEYGGRIGCISHVRELIEQVADHMIKAGLTVGIYSAGLGSRDVGYPVTVAGIQSVYQKAEILGKLDVILVDEAHRIPSDGEGMYRTFLEDAKKANPNVRLVGLTATPFRLDCGLIYGKGQLFERVAYEIGVRKLINDGYLSPLKSKVGIEKTNLSEVSIQGGEFVKGELERAMMADEQKVVMACMEIAEKTQDRKSVLVFATGIAHMTQIAKILDDLGVGMVRTIYGETPDSERISIVRDFREGRIKFLVNCEVLTTGFDAPNVDAIGILRPTLSPGLFAQMVGRGLRIAPGKTDCAILDFGGNLLRHGPIDRMLIDSSGHAKQDAWKECPECHEVVARSAEICFACGFKFPALSRGPRGINHDEKAGTGNVLSEPEPVESITYSKHVKKGAPEGHPPTLKVTYICGMAEIKEFVCLEHSGFARDKALMWWRQRAVSNEVPSTIAQALELIAKYGIKEPKRIVLETEGKYLRVAQALELQRKEPRDVGVAVESSPGDLGEVPF